MEQESASGQDRGRGGGELTCPRQLRLPKVLQAWLKSSSSQRVPPMQSRLSRLRLLDSSLRDGRQLRTGGGGGEKESDAEDKKRGGDQRGCEECGDGADRR